MGFASAEDGANLLKGKTLLGIYAAQSLREEAGPDTPIVCVPKGSEAAVTAELVSNRQN